VDGERVKSTCWYGSFINPHTGKRLTKRLYSDKTASRRELDRMIQEAERTAAGVIDRYAVHRTRPIAEHVAEYLAHCEHVGQAKRHRHVKEADLKRLIDAIGAQRLTDLEPNAVERHLQGLRDARLSARKINAVRAHVMAFMNWCLKTGRCADNPLSIVSKLDDRQDRRRVRRPLTEDELIRLLEAAEHRPEAELLMIRRGPNKGTLKADVRPDVLDRARSLGKERRLIYLTAALTGLRRGELGKITWGDVDLEASTICVRVDVGKSKREDFIPLHPQIQTELAQFKPADARTTNRVFRTVPSIRAFYRDLEQARATWLGEAKDDRQELERREKSDFLKRKDEQGRVVDLHAMRTTLGTTLARFGVAPQLAQRIMRHSDYRTTLGHYTVLGLHDTARAMETLPPIEAKQQAFNASGAAARTGTECPRPGYGQDVVAPVVANEGLLGSSRGTTGHVRNTADSRIRRPGDGAQARDSSMNNPSCHRVSRGVRQERATGLEPATFSLEG
jgi:integrase